MGWDPFQREALDALGHRLYRIDGAPGGGEEQSAAAQLPPGPLLDALLRAAGLPDEPAAIAALATHWNGAPLRSAAARRALWPALRALRRRDG